MPRRSPILEHGPLALIPPPEWQASLKGAHRCAGLASLAPQRQVMRSLTYATIAFGEPVPHLKRLPSTESAETAEAMRRVSTGSRAARKVSWKSAILSTAALAVSAAVLIRLLLPQAALSCHCALTMERAVFTPRSNKRQ